MIQITDTYDNTLFIELSKDGSYWNVNSAGIFRKGYSNKKETVVKTEPRQPSNANSNRSSLSEGNNKGIVHSEPNGKPTISDSKDSELSQKSKDDAEENNIFAKENTFEYETEEGKTITYSSEARLKAYQPNLFDYDFSGDTETGKNGNSKTSPNGVQRKVIPYSPDMLVI